MDNSGFASVKKWLVNRFSSPIEHQPAGDESSRVGFTSAEHLAHNYAGQRLQAGPVTHVTAARGTLSKRTRALKGTDGQHHEHAGAIAFLKRVFGSRSTAGRVPTPQDLSVTKQHRNYRWDRCTASAGDWLIITTASATTIIAAGPVQQNLQLHARWKDCPVLYFACSCCHVLLLLNDVSDRFGF